MAMSRGKFKRRPFARRSFGRSFRRGPKFARQKFDKIVLFNNLNAGPNVLNPAVSDNLFCSPVSLGACGRGNIPPQCGPATTCNGIAVGLPGSLPCSCCVTRANFQLISNTTLQSYFQDSVTLVRTYGDIWYRAFLRVPTASERCTMTSNDLAAFEEVYRNAYAEQWHWSMRKKEQTQADDESNQLDLASPIFDYDWTESSPPWLWQRTKMWFPNVSRGFTRGTFDNSLGVCSNTHQASYIVPPFADGDEPGWVVPAVSTDCTIVRPAEVGVCGNTDTSYVVREPPWHHLRFSSKKHIKMVRDQDLNLACTVRHPAVSLLGGWNCVDPAIITGFPGIGQVSYQFFVRIASTVRLN